MLNKIHERNYTGMYDYYNTPIADGDIIEVHRGDSCKNHVAQVFYNPYMAAWGYHFQQLGVFEPLSFWCNPDKIPKTVGTREDGLDLLEERLIGLVVVGNVWDNPEDLKRKPGFRTVLRVIQIH